MSFKREMLSFQKPRPVVRMQRNLHGDHRMVRFVAWQYVCTYSVTKGALIYKKKNLTCNVI